METIALLKEVYSNGLVAFIAVTSVFAFVFGKGRYIQALIGKGPQAGRLGGALMIVGSVTLDIDKFVRGCFLLVTGRPPSNYEATVQGRVLDSLKKVGIIGVSCFFLSCSSVMQRAAEQCPVPTLRAALAVAAVAADVAEQYCSTSHEAGCEQKVKTVRVVVEASDSTLGDVCEVLPAIEDLDCENCKPAIGAARKAACL